MAFLAMSMGEIFHSFNMRSQRKSVIAMEFSGSHNKYLYLGMVVSIVMTTLVIYVPFLATAFDFTHITAFEYFVAMGLAVLIIQIVEIIKVFQRINTKRKESKK
jgi:Ca2+-transporting ATPase